MLEVEQIARRHDGGDEPNLAELETFGFTVIEPGRVAPPEFLDRARRAVLETAERRTGVKHDLEAGIHGTLEQEPPFSHQYILYYLLLEDPVFQEYVTNLTLLTLMTYLLDFDFKIHSLTSFVKWENEAGYGPSLGLHMDSPVRPLSLLAGKDCHSANSAFLLTDYTRDNGSLAFVPGSHRIGRQPKPGEGADKAIPLEAPAGSLVLWHGNLWHGAFPRTNPGLRLNLTGYFSRSYITVQENYRDTITQEVLDRNPKRLAVLIGMGDDRGWRSADGPRFSHAYGVLADAYEEAGYPMPKVVAQYRKSQQIRVFGKEL